MPPKAKPKAARSRSPSPAPAISKAKAKASASAANGSSAKESVSPTKEADAQKDQIVKAFRSFDANGDGKIMRDDLFAVMRFISDATEFGDADLEILMDQMDASKSGWVDYEEFAAWIMAGSAQASMVAQRSADPDFLQQRLEWCMAELKRGEDEVDSLKPRQVWFNRDDNVGITFGRGAEGKANRVMRIVRDSAAHKEGIEIGWLVISVGDTTVQGTTYVPDLIMAARETGSALVKFVTLGDLEEQRRAEDKLPELMAAVDLARMAIENQSRSLPSVSKATELEAAESESPPAQPAETQPPEKPDDAPDPSKALALYQPKTADTFAPSYDQLMIAMGCQEEEDDTFQGNPYTILGVGFTATREEIKTAFMTLARMYHPDKYPENPEAAKQRFDRIKQAYDVLRDEEARAKLDGNMVRKGIGQDLLTLYAMDPKKAIEKMIKVPDDYKDPAEDPGLNKGFKEKGVAVVKYFDYKMPFPVPDGRLAVSEIDEVYGIRDVCPGCQFFLAEWRPGDNHRYQHGEPDRGDSSLLTKDAETFCGLEAGMTYFLLVLESKEEAAKREAEADFIRKQREAVELASKIIHDCKEEQIYIFGLGYVCRLCTDASHKFR
jgi:hypothetical protein